MPAPCVLRDDDDDEWGALLHESERKERQLTQTLCRPMTRDVQLDHGAVPRMQLNGWERYRLLMRMLDTGKEKRAIHQVAMHKQFIQSTAPLIWGAEYAASSTDVKKFLNCDEILQIAATLAGRRWGKTFALARFVAAFAVSIPMREGVSIFSTSKRISTRLLRLVEKMVREMQPHVPGLVVEKCNEEMLWLRGPGGPDDIRKIFSFPSNKRVCFLYLCAWGSFWIFLAGKKRGRGKGKGKKRTGMSSASPFVLVVWIIAPDLVVCVFFLIDCVATWQPWYAGAWPSPGALGAEGNLETMLCRVSPVARAASCVAWVVHKPRSCARAVICSWRRHPRAAMQCRISSAPCARSLKT